MKLPACGIYRTQQNIAGIHANVLVYFHNHGNPGPGVYLPESWKNNRATFSTQGTTLPEDVKGDALMPLPLEGFYRVVEEFSCCEKKCRTYAANTLVQLGYNGKGRGIVFTPTLTAEGLFWPDRGNIIEDVNFSKLERLQVAQEHPDFAGHTPSTTLH